MPRSVRNARSKIVKHHSSGLLGRAFWTTLRSDRAVKAMRRDETKAMWPRRRGESKINAQSLLRGYPGRPKSTPGPSEATPEHPGTIRSAPDVPHEHPERAPGAPGRPLKSAKVAPERQKERPRASGSAPRRPKSTLNRARERKSRAFVAQRNREALTD